MNAKPLASLTSSLLARKGQAKPAMRPQGFAAGFGGGGTQEDLGWNDMGYDAPRVASADTVSAEPPVVVRQQEELAAKLDAQPQAAAVPAMAPALKRPRAARVLDGRKAAFTLRLNEERHLKLRLASAVRRQSSQQLVTAALDAFLVTIPELDALAARAKRDGKEPGHA
jgi:hypothetical protein